MRSTCEWWNNNYLVEYNPLCAWRPLWILVVSMRVVTGWAGCQYCCQSGPANAVNVYVSWDWGDRSGSGHVYSHCCVMDWDCPASYLPRKWSLLMLCQKTGSTGHSPDSKLQSCQLFLLSRHEFQHSPIKHPKFPWLTFRRDLVQLLIK